MSEKILMLETWVTRNNFYVPASELREAYRPTPWVIRQLFFADPENARDPNGDLSCSTDTWLLAALAAGAVSAVPSWVSELFPHCRPTLECRPCKSPGAWRLYNPATSVERHVSSESLAKELGG